MTKTRRVGVLLTLTAGLFAIASVLLAGAAAAQTESCPAGARGGAGGNAGSSTGGTGGLALNVPVFSSGTGGATGGGGNGGSARGGSGGRGGQGTLPVCNQNTNGGGAAAAGRTSGGGASGGGAGAGGARYGAGGPLAHTGSHTAAELGVAGLSFLLGGTLLLAGQPRRRRA